MTEKTFGDCVTQLAHNLKHEYQISAEFFGRKLRELYPDIGDDVDSLVYMTIKDRADGEVYSKLKVNINKKIPLLGNEIEITARDIRESGEPDYSMHIKKLDQVFSQNKREPERED